MTSKPQKAFLPPKALLILKHLHRRTLLSVTEKSSYNNLTKGYQGEQKLHDILTHNLSPQYLILNDLLINCDNTEFQIDTLLIGKNTIYHLEVKNYTGDFYLEQDNFYSALSRNEIRNPLHQLKRSELLLGRFLKQKNHAFTIESYVIFINPEFQLYQATLNSPIIFPSQINRFIEKLNTQSFQQTSLQHSLAKALIGSCIDVSTHERLPIYEYDKLKKGIICMSCGNFLKSLTSNKLICPKCSFPEDIDEAVKRSIQEFNILFPEEKITTSRIQDWCAIINSKKTIRRVLKKHLISVNKYRHTYYIFPK